MGHTPRTALLTGGAGFLGQAIARRLVRDGYRVALIDRDETALGNVARVFPACPWRAADVADAASLKRAIDELARELGEVSVLVNSAGIVGPVQSVVDLPVDVWDQVIRVNLSGTFHACKHAIPHLLKARSPRIVNVASISGKEGNPDQAAYSASKGGVIALTKALAKELSTTGVLVNAIAPAAIRSPLNLSMTPQQIEYVASKIPMGRIGEPEEVAAMVAWMVSEECSFSTGAVFDLSGGRATY